MSWYDSDYADRYMVSVDNSAGAASVDIEIVVPPEHPLWDLIQSSGDDIRVTAADGVTLLDYAWTGYTYADREGTIQVDAVTLQATAGVYVLWVYAGYASATDGSAAVTITSAVAGYISLASPKGSPYLVPVTRPQPGTTQPRVRLQKQVDEKVHFWWDITDILERASATYQGYDFFEEPYGAQFSIETGGSAQASMIEQASTRFVEVIEYNRGRRRYVVVVVKAGSDGTDYTMILGLLTSAPPSNTSYLQHQPRAFLSVVDTDEA